MNTSAPAPERVAFTIPEVAQATGLSAVMLRKHVAAHLIPSIKIGGRRLIPATWLNALDPEVTR